MSLTNYSDKENVWNNESTSNSMVCIIDAVVPLTACSGRKRKRKLKEQLVDALSLTCCSGRDGQVH